MNPSSFLDSKQTEDDFFENTSVVNGQSPCFFDRAEASIAPTTDRIETTRQTFERMLSKVLLMNEERVENVWKEYLQFEFEAGPSTKFNLIFQRAISRSSFCEMSLFVIRLFTENNNFKEGERFVKELLKKSKEKLKAWSFAVQFYSSWRDSVKGDALLHKLREDELKKMIEKGVHCLPMKHHLAFLRDYAIFEYKKNNVQKARSTFERILVKFPKKREVWDMYIEAEQKYTKHIPFIRELFHRLTDLRQNLKDMESLFSKYYEFEKKFGDEASMAQAKSKAQKSLNDYLSLRAE